MDFNQIALLVGPSAHTVLEIGANDGLCGLQIAELLPQVQVYAFEPDPRAIRRFKASVSHPRVHLFEKAVGRANGVKVLFYQSNNIPIEHIDKLMPEGWDYSGSIHKPTEHLAVEHSWLTFDKTIEVDMISLDAWFFAQKLHSVDFIWADVQGAEADLVLGGKETLARTRFLYTECHKKRLYEGSVTLDELLQLLPNFEIVELFDEDVLLRNVKFSC